MERKILGLYNDILEDNVSILKRFLELDRYKINCNLSFLSFASYSNKYISKYLSEHKKAEEFYMAHLVYGWTLYACVNDETLVTYKVPVEVEESFDYAVTYHGSVQEGLRCFNKEFYGDRKDRYYELRINGGKPISQYYYKCPKCDRIFRKFDDRTNHMRLTGHNVLF